MAYNLATSRNPSKLVVGTYTAVTFGYWFYCRANYRSRQHRMKMIQSAMTRRAYLEGTEADEEWARNAVDNKRTEVRNLRSDALPQEEGGAKS